MTSVFKKDDQQREKPPFDVDYIQYWLAVVRVSFDMSLIFLYVLEERLSGFKSFSHIFTKTSTNSAKEWEMFQEGRKLSGKPFISFFNF